MAGNHGDEYEGEIALGRLIRRLDPARVREITILPMANVPAVMAARRRSPLDNGNLNRAFPGSPGGTPTERLAHFLEHELFPRHDVVFDIHSGGTSMAHLPTALIEKQVDPARMDQALALLASLGMDHAFIATNGRDAPTSMAAAARGRHRHQWRIRRRRHADAGHAGRDPARHRPAAAGAGRIDAPVLGPHAPADSGMQLLALDSHAQAIFATRRGWFEPAVDIGAQVSAGDLAGYYHD